MSIPKSKTEALSLGYKPLDKLKDILDPEDPAVSGRLSETLKFDILGQIDCSDPENNEKTCQIFHARDGRIVIFTCQGGACSRDSALIAPFGG